MDTLDLTVGKNLNAGTARHNSGVARDDPQCHHRLRWRRCRATTRVAPTGNAVIVGDVIDEHGNANHRGHCDSIPAGRYTYCHFRSPAAALLTPTPSHATICSRNEPRRFCVLSESLQPLRFSFYVLRLVSRSRAWHA